MKNKNLTFILGGVAIVLIVAVAAIAGNGGFLKGSLTESAKLGEIKKLGTNNHSITAMGPTISLVTPEQDAAISATGKIPFKWQDNNASQFASAQVAPMHSLQWICDNDVKFINNLDFTKTTNSSAPYFSNMNVPYPGYSMPVKDLFQNTMNHTTGNYNGSNGLNMRSTVYCKWRIQAQFTNPNLSQLAVLSPGGTFSVLQSTK